MCAIITDMFKIIILSILFTTYQLPVSKTVGTNWSDV